jgi:hypothetical protein
MAEDKSKGRLPDYSLGCLHKPTESRGKVGVAWRNSDNSIRIVLDPFVTLPPGREIVLTLFKFTPDAKTPPLPASRPRSAADVLDDLESSSNRQPGDEVPF